jgi:hypothetical protein
MGAGGAEAARASAAQQVAASASAAGTAEKEARAAATPAPTLEDYLCLRTYHDGYKALEPIMLFNLSRDFHLQEELSGTKPAIVDKALSLLEGWYQEQMKSSDYDVDPLMTVLREGGPFYTRGQLGRFIERLNATGRSHHAQRLAERHPNEI